jgi:hypothetical protein
MEGGGSVLMGSRVVTDKTRESANPNSTSILYLV